MAGEMIEGVNPTRMELLKIRKQISLAQKGHKLLKEKRDAIIMEFFKFVERAREIRSAVDTQLTKAYGNLTVAQAVAGTGTVQGAASASRKAAEFEPGSKNIMGVAVPTVEEQEFRRKLVDRGYGFSDTNIHIDEASGGFEDVLTTLLKVGEVETSVRKLAAEIQKTKRRVNALEYIRIPRLNNTRKYIDMRLNEMERENFFRLKIIKRRLTK